MEIESNQKRLRRREKGRKYQTFCKNDMNKKRVIWIELLRVMACIGVIGIHAGSQHFRDMPLDSSGMGGFKLLSRDQPVCSSIFYYDQWMSVS